MLKVELRSFEINQFNIIGNRDAGNHDGWMRNLYNLVKITGNGSSSEWSG